MFARLTEVRFAANADREAARAGADALVDLVAQASGVVAVLWLGDPEGKRAVGITVFADKEDLQSTAGAAGALRPEILELLGAEVVQIREYQVIAERGLQNYE